MDKNKNKKEKPKYCSKANDKVSEINSMQSQRTDPFGSYTGVPENPYEKPVQDVDDL